MTKNSFKNHNSASNKKDPFALPNAITEQDVRNFKAEVARMKEKLPKNGLIAAMINNEMRKLEAQVKQKSNH